MKAIVGTLVLVLLLVPMAVFAQTTTVEVKSGEVISVYGDQLVVKMSTGETKSVTVPAGFMFKVNGVDTPLADLKPGTKLTAEIKTTTRPETVRTTKIKNGEVVKVTGSQLWVKMPGEGIKAFSIPAGFTFVQDGQNVSIDQLRPGTKLNAEIVYKSEKTVTEKEAQIAGVEPVKAEPAAAPVAEAAPAAPAAEAAPATLPKTASNVALIGLLGLGLVAAGFYLRRS